SSSLAVARRLKQKKSKIVKWIRNEHSLVNTIDEITQLEEQLRLAELGPDPTFFKEALADDAVMASQDGATFAKAKIIEAHQPGGEAKFTRVEVSEMKIIDHGA